MSTLPKPELRGHVRRYGTRMISTALALGVTSALLYNWLVRIPRIRAYEEFIQTYDPVAHERELVKYKIIPHFDDNEE